MLSWIIIFHFMVALWCLSCVACSRWIVSMIWLLCFEKQLNPCETVRWRVAMHCELVCRTGRHRVKTDSSKIPEGHKSQKYFCFSVWTGITQVTNANPGYQCLQSTKTVLINCYSLQRSSAVQVSAGVCTFSTYSTSLCIEMHLNIKMVLYIGWTPSGLAVFGWKRQPR